MPPRDIAERVEQLEVRVTALEGLPGEVGRLTLRMTTVESQIVHLRQEMKVEFSSIHARLGQYEARFDGIDARLDGIDARLDGIDARLDGIDTRLDGIDSRLDGIDSRLDGIDSRLDGVDRALVGLHATIEEKWTHTRALFEDVLQRISAIGDDRPARRSPRSRPSKRR